MKLASSHVNSTIYKFAQLPGWTTSAPKYRSGERLRRTWMQHRRKHRVQLGLMEMPLALKAFGHKQKSWTKYNFDLIKGNYWIHLAYWTIICCSAHALPKCERNDGFKKKKKYMVKLLRKQDSWSNTSVHVGPRLYFSFCMLQLHKPDVKAGKRPGILSATLT